MGMLYQVWSWVIILGIAPVYERVYREMVQGEEARKEGV